MGSKIRFLAAIFILGPLSAMLVEPFFEALYDRLEWDTEDFVAPIVRWLSGMTALPSFWPVSMGMIGLGVGVWLHYLAWAFDRKARPKERMPSLGHSLSHILKKLNYFVKHPQTDKRVQVINPTVPTGETATIRSLMVSLKEFGIPVPRVGSSVNVGEARMISEYLATISSFVSNNQKRECKRVAQEFLKSNQDERPRLLSRLGILSRKQPKSRRD